jgi:hypothetical protein
MMMMKKKTRGWGCMGMSLGEAVAEVVVVGAVAVAVAIRSTTPWGERWRRQRRGAGWERWEEEAAEGGALLLVPRALKALLVRLLSPRDSRRNG